MSVKLVTYDISDTDQRNACREAIKQYEYIEIGESDYLIHSDESCSDIKSALMQFLDNKSDNDELFVCTITKDEWSSFHIGVTKRNWISRNT